MPAFVPERNAVVNHALAFAVVAHGNQVRKGNEHIPYIFHPVDVANEVIYHSGLSIEDLELAKVVAILHDVVEDCAVSIEAIGDQFGDDIANGVAAMSKNEAIAAKEDAIDKSASLGESLDRLEAAPKWAQCVKLADRVSNLKSFPAMWGREKVASYLNESEVIAERLGSASSGLKARLLSRIADARVMLSLRS